MSKIVETTQDDYEKGWAGLQVFYLHVGYFLLIISAPSMLKIVLGPYYHHKVIYIFWDSVLFGYVEYSKASLAS